MFKSVLIIIFVVIILFISRTVMQRLKKPEKAMSRPDNRDTVQCIQCKTYIPSEDAIFKGNQSFCSQQHLSDWDQ